MDTNFKAEKLENNVVTKRGYKYFDANTYFDFKIFTLRHLSSQQFLRHCTQPVEFLKNSEGASRAI